MISVLVLTLNEEGNLKDCLESVPWRDDVHVLDSGSLDGTAALAQSLGAIVHIRDFTTYAEQRNAGLALPYLHPWLLMIDADERLTPELANEIACFVRTAPSDCVMAMMRRKDMFLGRWLRRSSGYPSWFPRLLRVGSVRVERAVNEEYVAEGERRMLEGPPLALSYVQRSRLVVRAPQSIFADGGRVACSGTPKLPRPVHASAEPRSASPPRRCEGADLSPASAAVPHFSLSIPSSGWIPGWPSGLLLRFYASSLRTDDRRKSWSSQERR